VNCRHCGQPLTKTFLDLGFAPPSNAYLSASDLRKGELYYPLKILVCEHCWLAQTEDYARADELFDREYAYFSSTSSGWLAHAKLYCEGITRRLGLDRNSFVIEVAANDGYLLKNFVAAGVPCLGIEPTASTAAAAEALGVPVVREFFGEALARGLAAQNRRADLVIGNNVYAHVPDINDFTRGLARVLKPGGTVTLEFPHLLRLLQEAQFDTVYHEHFSYLSIMAVERIFGEAGLRIIDVEKLPTHGGSLRIFGCLDGDVRKPSPAVAAVLREEKEYGLGGPAAYEGLQQRAQAIKNGLLTFLLDCQRSGVKLAAYGAAAKGNTLLNFAGVKPDLLPYVCDAAAAKQGKYLPGSHVPIVAPDQLDARKPDVVLILPWNIADEVAAQYSRIREWGGRFVVAVPEVRWLT
jgi:SAM-dependent methyltransferase